MQTNTIDPAATDPAAAKPSRPSIDVPYIDGMRGLAAMAVVLYHAYHNVDKRMLGHAKGGHASNLLEYLVGWMNNGQFAVQVFIVISGFCLMLPVILSGKQALSKGPVDFFRRRVRRILPPYYAALILSLIGYGLLSVLHRHHGGGGGFATPEITKGQILSHIFLIQNCRADWSHTIDGPMWSVAAEWHIYMLFPFLLIPIWRRFGNLAVVLFAMAIGVIPHYLFPKVYYDYMYLIYLFAIGMVAATVCYARDTPLHAWASKVKWGWVVSTFAVLFAIWSFTMPIWFTAGWEIGGLTGLLAASTIIFCHFVPHDLGVAKHWLPRIFESRMINGLGVFSYSIYLVHHPILMIFCQVIGKKHFGPAATLGLELLIGVPLAVLLAYGFFRLFEKPFMSRRALNKEKAVEPAP